VADSLSSAQARANQITAELAADQQHLDVISEQYDTAQQQVQQIGQQMDQIRSTIDQDQAQVTQDQANLRQQAVTSYMDGATTAGLQSLFDSGSEKATAADEYRSVASGDISGAIDSLGDAQTHLATQQSALQSAQTQAQAALTQVTTSRQAAQVTVADQEAILSGLKGQIATLVAQKQAAEAAASHAAFEARLRAAAAQATATAAVSTPASSPVRNVPTLPALPAAGGAGQAVAAAESQIGVPYVWGGESPGRGFDCSGLVQWAWGQAGVGLPRTAAAQYDAVAHIPLSDLQPGDLVFWGYGGISHVGMYVGGGDVVDAPQTGEDVQIQPIWNGGLVGAGRP
jgi:cell wall-associated NlpC family hydrolase